VIPFMALAVYNPIRPPAGRPAMPTARSTVPLTLLALLLPAAMARATPANKKALADFLGPFAPAKGVDCRTCHVAATPTPEDHDHNPFGERLVEVRKELKKAGKSADLRARLLAVADEDSDGDGIANFVELLTGHSPGDAADRPSADELKDVAGLQAKFHKYLAAYPWRPFEPVRRPATPDIRHAQTAIRNPIDAFLETARRDQGLSARPPAPKHVLLRRVYLDLIGLPPTPEELEAFERDEAPDAYERVVDRLLASPQYGERWGRHWMDVWRYSDWAGYGAEVRESQPHIWRWRDWIVESLNADKGYDRMVQEMLAGDELAPTDPATLRATGFLVRQYYKFNRNVVLDSTVEHTAKAFLGVTLNCARCHDHMYDPIAQTEYYSFRAFFEPQHIRTDRLPGQADTGKLGLVRAYDAGPNPPTYLFTRGDEKAPDKARLCPPATPAALGGPPLDIQPVPLPRDASQPDKRPFVIAEARAAALWAVRSADTALATAQGNTIGMVAASFRATPGGALMLAPVLHSTTRGHALARLDVLASQAAYATLEATLQAERFEDDGKLAAPDGQRAAELAVVAQRQHALAKARRDLLAAEIAAEAAPAKTRPAAAAKVAPARAAQARAKAEAVAPLHANYTRRPQAVYPAASTGRRLALARWITDRSNPLAARVAVNHVWARHFGRPLVPTVFDFGRNGQPPTHPALLDWLAAEFMDRGWSLKYLHRLIVTSHAYRQDSRPDPACLAADSENRYLWRMEPRRMEAEVVRDSVLAIAGRLDLTFGGLELDHNLGLTTFRRSLYYRHANEKQMLFLATFDAANVNECYQRSASIVPQQALALANSSLTLDASRRVAHRLREEIGLSSGDGVFVRRAFLGVLNRPPSDEEIRACVEYLATQTERLRAAHPPAADPRLRAEESLLHVLFNYHDFLSVH
jgi:hypothetical protein